MTSHELVESLRARLTKLPPEHRSSAIVELNEIAARLRKYQGDGPPDA